MSCAATASAKACLALTAACALVVGCSRPPAASALAPGERVRAFVSILPHAYFVERVGGKMVQVEVMVQPGQSPHLYEPTPQQMAALSGSHVYFATGMEFEQKLLERILGQMGKLQVVDLRKGVELRRMAPDEQCAHDPDGEHSHEGHAHGQFDPHIWLSPRAARVQAQTICDALARLQPAGRAEFERNLSALLQDLDECDAALSAKLAPLKGRSFIVFHPTYGYLADAYGLKQVAIETEGKEPTPADLRAIIDRARKVGAPAVLTERQYSSRSAEAIAREIGATVIETDPLARDVLANLRQLADAIARAAGAPPPSTGPTP